MQKVSGIVNIPIIAGDCVLFKIIGIKRKSRFFILNDLFIGIRGMKNGH